MVTLPSSIEVYLVDAGFSGTEVLIVKKLLEEDALTLREIASKTGKSTGVLDQAMKKLMKKGIVARETINETPKYILQSLHTVLDWMKDDMANQQQMIIRKYENFESFISNVQKTKKRPEMEFFEGKEGMKRAYFELFKRGKVFLRYGPTLFVDEEDPLHDFRAEFFRECQRREIFTRVITHDTPLGRRYKSRDAFEYRETLLVEEDRYPFQFDKIIVGDTVACFQLDLECACFIRYTELAEEERFFFERLWNKKKMAEQKRQEEKNRKAEAVALLPVIDGEIVVSTRVSLLSKMREFFLGRRGIVGLSTCAVIAAVLTGVFSWQILNANLQKAREQVKTIAATGALQFNALDLDQIHTKADIVKPEYAKVIQQLNAVRNQNKDIAYIYILRLKYDNNYEYVADADSLNPDALYDLNKDGKIDAADENITPGRSFTGVDDIFMKHLYQTPVADPKPYTDQWGTFIGGYAPIYDTNGNINAILGVDKWAKDIFAGLTIQEVTLFFFLSFLIFISIWLAAFDQTLLKEIQTYMKEQKNTAAEILKFFFSRRSLLMIGILAVLSALVTFGFYQNNESLNLKRMQEKVLSIAATAALQFDPKDLNQLHTVADIGKPEYAKVIYLLNAIRQQNDGVKYTYVMRPTSKQGIWEFIADADSLDPYARKDLNGDGQINDEDHLSPPGETYDAKSFSDSASQMALVKPVTSGPNKDQWGNIISGWAPIKNNSGTTVAIFGVDKFTSDVHSLTLQTFEPVYYFFAIFFICMLIRLAAFNRSLFKEICELVRVRKFAITIGVGALLSIVMTFILYEYTQQLNLSRMKDKVIAIASTAASQFNAHDLNALQVKEDWKKPEWIKIGRQLEKIRKENKDVVFAYIFRKSRADARKMEFAGDADSINPYANTDNDPTNDVDMNHDGKIDGSPTGGDYQSWPGQPYPTAPAISFDAYNGPVATDSYYEDQWGKYISGYAPIKDEQGNVAGIIAIDMSPDTQRNLTNEAFAPIYVFFLFFGLFVLFRMKGFSKSLLHQLLRPFKSRLTVLIVLFSITFISGIIFAIYQYTLHLMTEEIGTRLMYIAATSAPEFNTDDLNQLHVAGDMKKEAYQRVFKKLNEIRKRNEKIQWAYIQRRTNIQGIFEFVADADSNYYIDFSDSLDYNNDGKLDNADQNVYPGLDLYEELEYGNTKKGEPFYQGPYLSQWGVYVSGYAPIRDKNGNVVAFLGLDMDVSEVYKIVRQKFGF